MSVFERKVEVEKVFSIEKMSPFYWAAAFSVALLSGGRYAARYGEVRWLVWELFREAGAVVPPAGARRWGS